MAQSRKSVAELTEELKALFAVASILAQPGSFEDKATRVLDELARVAQADRVFLRLSDEQAGGLRLVASVGPGMKDTQPMSVVPYGKLLAGRAFERGEPVIVNDYASYSGADPAWAAGGVRSSGALPVRSGGAIVGTLGFNSASLGHFTPERVRLLSAIADGMGALLENARLTEAVRESERKYRSLFEQSRDAIFISTQDGKVVDVNQACLELFGYTRSEALDLDVRDVYVDPAQAEVFQRELHEKGSIKDFEVRLRRKDGTEMVCLVTASHRVMSDGTHLGEGIIRDITERKRAEQALRDSEERARRLVKAMPIPMLLTRLSDGKVLYANEHIGRLFGYPPDTLIGRGAPDFYYDVADRAALLEDLKRQGHLRNREVSARKADGSQFWVNVSVEPTVFDGEDALLTAFYDVTERRRAEELFRTLAQNSPIGMFIVQEDGKFGFVNNQLQADSGHTAEELLGSEALAHVHPDDRELVRRNSESMANGDCCAPFEYRVITKSGETAWIIGSFAPIEYEGRPAVVGSYMDITERKRAEEALRQSEEQTRRLASEHSVMAEIGRIISSSLDIDDVYERFAEQVRRLIPFDRISIGLVDLDEDIFTDAYHTGIEVPGRGYGAINKLAGSMTGQIVRTRAGMILDLAGEEEFFKEYPRAMPDYQAGLRTSMSVPLISNDEVIGVLHLHSVERNAYTERDMAVAERVGAQIAGAIANARLYAERKRAEAQVLASLEEKQALLERIQQLYRQEQRRAEQMRTINDIAVKISSVLSLNELLPYVADLVRDTFGYYNVNILVMAQETDELVVGAAVGGYQDKLPTGARLKLETQSITGWVFKTGEALKVNDVSVEPRYYPALDGVKSELAVPIKQGEQVLGVLDIESTELDAFDDLDVSIAQTLANQLAVAIENARLFEQSREVAVLEERNRMAREIHDTLAQGFTGIILQLEAAEQDVEEKCDEDLPGHLASAKTLARESLQQARRSVWNLLPQELERRNLEDALREEVRRFADAGREKAHFVLSGDSRELRPDVQAALLRICQESLTNVRRHAHAQEVRVELTFHSDAISLRVQDNGIGFDMHAPRPKDKQVGPSAELRTGFGLVGMEQRARLLKGSFGISGEKGKGTVVEVRIPLDRG
jgi:PAS domain S-box-containing protein